ncbi:hypothetical protein K2173_016424 [Erythroxylum novogranatense]|uniref:Uncharacterized protein n=1 Tax=Erythroxylum novogranatense TaxID=1862640 RepID=A0AAV8SGF4_9ROSI|nr:hypothetical protein K2173_016424 [Erythroxylum novogranatense]
MDKVATITTLTTRRPRWQYPQAPPTPRILHLPRRPRRKPNAKTNANKNCLQRDRKERLETLFDQEREFIRDGAPVVVVSGCRDDQSREERRQGVEERNTVLVEEEKWKFQAEMLRAECNLLRMEREIAVKKMERRRVQMERTLRSAIQTLISGKERISEGKNARTVLEEEIQELAEKLEKLQRRSLVKDLRFQKCSNFDKQASHLRRQLEKFAAEPDDICVKEIQEIAEASLPISNSFSFIENSASMHSYNMEILRRKMEALAKGTILENMEDEYRSILSSANSSATSSASTSKRIELPGMSTSSIRSQSKATRHLEERACSGCCKAIVRRVIEQVRAETEQWSQMQDMLAQVRDEMEELQASRDFWEDRAIDSDHQIQSLQSDVQAWSQRALSSEAKANELQAQVCVLHTELERWRKERVAETAANRSSPTPLSQDTSIEKEKRVLVCRLKKKHPTDDDGYKQKKAFSDGRRRSKVSTIEPNVTKRSPLRDIGNSPPLAGQNSTAVFPWH